jgi:hypothetical protein
MKLHKTLVAAAVVVSSLALAAPSFAFVKDAGMNGMMGTMGGKDVIELAAVPGMSLKAKNVSASHATFIYAAKDADKDGHAVFAFYEKALLKEGWKAAGMMGAMTDNSTMKKDEGAMMKPVKLEEKFSLKSNSILVTAVGSKDRVEVDLELK